MVLVGFLPVFYWFGWNAYFWYRAGEYDDKLKLTHNILNMHSIT